MGLLMLALIQRVRRAQVVVEAEIVGSVGQGLLALVAIERDDTSALVPKLLHKLLNYRVFADADDKMNRSLLDIGGELLLVSQFTLAADTQSGLRPSFTPAAPPALGKALFEELVNLAQEQLGARLATGRFGADMQVELINDGPVTFMLHIR
jgi:D-aminoacyl-tRNA deacylase